ncbi:MAG: hypothetical protein DME24_18160, partial [Verrucomicrobia bacterium]
MLLISILLLPLATGLVCLLVRSRPTLERLNLLAFAAGALLAGHLGARVIAAESVSALGGFLYADALSALVVGLTALVALVSGIYSVGYLRRDAGAGRITATQVHRYYTLTPLFVFAMLLVTLASVLLISFYNEKTSLEAAWKYIIIGSVGISLALFGTILTYYAALDVPGAKAESGLNWSQLVGLARQFNPHAM